MEQECSCTEEEYAESFIRKFEYKKPTEKSIEQIKNIREGCKGLSKIIMDNSNFYGGDFLIALQKLEEVSMWANKAIVFSQSETKKESK